MEEKLVQPHLRQITAGRVLGAVALMGLCYGAGATSPDQNLAIWIVRGAVIALSPFVAAGTIFGQPLRGLIIGIVFIGVYALVAIAVLR